MALRKRLVQTVKQAIRAGHQKGVSLEKSLDVFLLKYRVTPHVTTGVSPSMLLYGRNLRTHLDLLFPDVKSHVQQNQAGQKLYHDRHSQHRQLQIGETVWARNFRDGNKWVKAVVHDMLGPLTYLLKLDDGNMWKRHMDHICRGVPEPAQGECERAHTASEEHEPTFPEPDSENATNQFNDVEGDHGQPHPDTQQTESIPGTPTRRCPTRSRRPPDRLM